jgi:hypothetical protein
MFFSALTNPRVLDQPEIYLGSTEHTSIGNCDPNQLRPTVSSISPNKAVVGATVNVTIVGTGFRSGSTIQPGSGITVSNIVVNSARTQITADFAIASNATGGNRSVKVTANGRQSLSSVNFFVQIPTELVPFNTSGAPNGVGPLQTPLVGDVINLAGTVLYSNVTGVYRNYAFALVDQDGQRILQGFTFTESFSNDCGTLGGLPPSFTSQVPANQILSDINAAVVQGPYNPQGYDCFDQTFSIIIGSMTFQLTPKFHVEVGKKNGQLIATRAVIQSGHTH